MNRDLFAASFANPAGSPIRELFHYLSKPGLISFAGGYPSAALLDAEGLREASNRVLAGGAGILQYGPTEGSPELKQELIGLSAGRGITCQAEGLLVTTGSQQAFDLLVRIFVQPGDAVLLESPAYPAAIQAFRLAGASIHEIPMDSGGLQTSRLEDVLRAMPPSSKPKLLYTVPTFSNPRGTLLSQPRREGLVRLALRHGFLIIEDDPYGELRFTEDRPEPLYVHGQRLAGADNPVIYLSSLSKTVAPALRIGWMVASPDVVRRSTIAKQTVDLCTSPITQLIAAEYLRSGRYPRTVAAAREEYKRRVEAMTESLRKELGGLLRFEEPKGGMFLWAESAMPMDPKLVFDAAVENGVLFVPGAFFFAGAPSLNSMRLSFAAPAVDNIHEGVRRLARAVRVAAEAVSKPQSFSDRVTP